MSASARALQGNRALDIQAFKRTAGLGFSRCSRVMCSEDPATGKVGPDEVGATSVKITRNSYCRFHLVCPGIKFGVRNFFWAWYKLKLICVLYFQFVPSPEKVSLTKFYPWTNQVESTIGKVF